jgi:hypothetical protein
MCQTHATEYQVDIYYGYPKWVNLRKTPRANPSITAFEAEDRGFESLTESKALGIIHKMLLSVT